MTYVIPETRRAEISDKIIDGTNPTPYFYIMIALSCVVATYGLLSDSTAVIIGAMLISPLMMPIIGVSLGASQGNRSLVATAIKSLLIGVAAAIVLSMVLSLLIPERVITSEILARTKPTLLDLIIALASGAAGTYAMCRRPDSAVLPGVAISTAIMPPICIIGIGVAFSRLDVAWGAFLLFSANIIAIIFASIVIFNLYGFKNRQGSQSEEGVLSRRIGRSIVYPVMLLVLVSIPLTLFMVNSVQDNQTRNVVRSTIEENIGKIVPGGEIVTLTSQKAAGKYVVDVVIRSTKPFTSENIRGIENELEYKLTLPVVVNADIVLVQQISDTYAVSGYEDLIKALTKTQPVEIVNIETPEELIGKAVAEKLSLVPGATVEGFAFSYDSRGGIYYVGVSVQYDGVIESNVEKSIVAVLEDRLKRKVSLTVTVSHGTNSSDAGQ